jgi:mono/diheme cytochrome c family protein
MAVMKRLMIVLALVIAPLIIGLLFTYDFIKIDWVSLMEIQPSYKWQEDPLPVPARSVPVQGTYNDPAQAAPVNPYLPTENSLARGKYFYDIDCALCHGPAGKGNGFISVYLTVKKPTDLTSAKVVNLKDGEIFLTISNGIEGAMPDLRLNLPDEEMRWSVVNYVRQLQKNTGK